MRRVSATLGLLAVIGLAPPVHAKEITVGLIPKGPIPWFNDCDKGAKAEAAKLGVNYQWVVPVDTQGSSQVTVIEQLTARKVDGIGISVDEPKSVVHALKEFTARGGKLITFDSDSPMSGRSMFIGTNNFAAGAIVGENMAKALNGKGSVGIITGELGAVDQNARIAGFRKALSKYPGIKIVALEGANDNLATGVPVVEAVLRSHPNITGLFGVGDEEAPAIAKALGEEEFRDRQSKITVLAFDDDTDTLKGIKAGLIQSTVVQRPTTECTLVVRNLVDQINGQLPKGNIDTGVTVVTKDNMTSYTK
jgi:ribose transport system substrate-binding protein